MRLRGVLGRGTRCAVVLVLLVGGIVAGVASGKPPRPTLAKLTADVPVVGFDGWLAWSVQRADGWHLTTLHDGQIAAPAIAPRPDLFDVDLGSDAAGRPVATFSRCQDHQTPDGPESVNCRLRVMDLQSGVESDPGVPVSAGASDSHPSMWLGRIAFARYVPGRNPDVEQIYLFTPGSPGLRNLGFGSVGKCRKPNSCTGDNAVSGSVGSLDLGQRRLAYLWYVGGDDFPDDATEVRVVRLSDAHSSFLAFGYADERCTEEDPDTITLGSPIVDADRVFFTETDSACYDARSYIVRVDARRRRHTAAKISGSLMEIARADGALYGLTAKTPSSEVDPSCDGATPCRLRRLITPHFKHKRRSVSPPFGY